MANIPCTLLMKSTDPVDVPTKMLEVLCKQLFTYGLKSLQTRKHNQVMMSLSYTSKRETLRNKFGNLPINCIKLALETKEEINLFELAQSKYTFNINADEEKKMLEEAAKPTVIWYNEDDDEDEPPRKKVKIVENRMMQPPSSSTAVAAAASSSSCTQKTVLPELVPNMIRMRINIIRRNIASNSNKVLSTLLI